VNLFPHILGNGRVGVSDVLVLTLRAAKLGIQGLKPLLLLTGVKLVNVAGLTSD
jgi:hypothetical protein